MPKTRDAFALKNWDLKRFFHQKRFINHKIKIDLSWFSNDKEAVNHFCDFAAQELDKGNIVEAYSIIEGLQWLSRKLFEFDTLVLRKHFKRLQKYSEKLQNHWANADDLTIEQVKEKSVRLSDLHSNYSKIATHDFELVEYIDKKIESVEQDFKQQSKIIFAGRLCLIRKKNNMTQQEVAKKLHIKQSSYSSYEKMTREPPLSTLVKLSRIFNCSVDWLLGLTP